MSPNTRMLMHTHAHTLTCCELEVGGLQAVGGREQSISEASCDLPR